MYIHMRCIVNHQSKTTLVNPLHKVSDQHACEDYKFHILGLGKKKANGSLGFYGNS